MIIAKLASTWYTSQGDAVRKPYTLEEVDAIAIYCEAIDGC